MSDRLLFQSYNKKFKYPTTGFTCKQRQLYSNNGSIPVPVCQTAFSIPTEAQLKSNCDVNLFSKISSIFKEWRVMNNVDRGGVIVLFVFQILYTDFFFATRLMINKINKVQWVDYNIHCYHNFFKVAWVLHNIEK